MDLSTNEARVALAAKYAAKYGLDPYLVCAVIEQESGWNPYAIRFEPAFLARYVAPKNPSAPTTDEIGRATSWGLMQTMGELAIEFHFYVRFYSELCDPDKGVDLGCQKLKQCTERHPHVSDALLAYNGGGNLEYAKQVLARVARYEPQAGAD